MENNNRSRAHSRGHATCVCRNCATGDNYRRFAKRIVKRDVRRSAALEIKRDLDDHTNHDGDVDHVVNISKLEIENVQNLRSIRQ
jgi:hypothetical protein